MRIGILGYGNLGKGVEVAIKNTPDMELVGVFTRRDPESIKIKTEGVKVYKMDKMLEMKKDIDVMIICGGSSSDLPSMTPQAAKDFNVIDSFDRHSMIPDHFEKVHKAAKEGGNIAFVSVGWDPGMFSVNRVYGEAILPKGESYTFWGKGVSQGHSQAIRSIEGVWDAKQYTVPIDSALEDVREGRDPQLTARKSHTRECFVVAQEGEDLERIEKEIKTMPGYFENYHTQVNFITKEELEREHSGIPHGGLVIRSGKTGWDDEHKEIIEYNLKLDSNPEFNASVMVAYARAAFKMRNRGTIGCKTVFDVTPADLSFRTPEELRKNML